MSKNVPYRTSPRNELSFSTTKCDSSVFLIWSIVFCYWLKHVKSPFVRS